MSPETPALSKPDFQLPQSHDAFLREIRCQFIILARKDEPTPDYARPGLRPKDEPTPDYAPDYAQDRVLDEVGRRLLARSLRPAAPADDQPEVIAARLQRAAAPPGLPPLPLRTPRRAIRDPN